MITVQLFLTAVAPAQTGAAVEMSMPSQIVGPRHAPVRGLILASLAICFGQASRRPQPMNQI